MPDRDGAAVPVYGVIDGIPERHGPPLLVDNPEPGGFQSASMRRLIRKGGIVTAFDTPGMYRVGIVVNFYK